MVIVSVVIALYIYYSSVDIAKIAAGLCDMVAIFISFLEIGVWTKVIYCERTIKKYTEMLWEKNFARYSDIIKYKRLEAWECEYNSLLEKKFWLDEKEKFLNKKEKRLQEYEEALKKR